MNRSLPFRLALALLCVATFNQAADTPSDDTLSLKYIEATLAYQRVKSVYPEISSVVTSIQVEKNSITLDTSDPRAGEVRRRLVQIDQRPKSMILFATVAETDEAHAQSLDSSADKILSRPTFYVQEGKAAVIYSKRGENGKVLKVTITGRSVADPAGK